MYRSSAKSSWNISWLGFKWETSTFDKKTKFPIWSTYQTVIYPYTKDNDIEAKRAHSGDTRIMDYHPLDSEWDTIQSRHSCQINLAMNSFRVWKNIDNEIKKN